MDELFDITMSCRASLGAGALLLLGLSQLGCVEPSAFVCSAHDQCGAGTCEPTGACSFADPSCPSGRRYGEHGPADVAGTCSASQATGDGVPGPDELTNGGVADAGRADAAAPDAAPEDAAPEDASLADAGPPCSGCVELWIEAESGALASVFQVGSDPAASGSAFIYSPEGSGSHGSEPDPEKLATYAVTVPVAGDYALWGRVYGTGNTSNSFWVIVAGGAPVEWHHDKDAWKWDLAGTFTLPAGDHEISVGVREDGDQLDALLLTDDLAYSP